MESRRYEFAAWMLRLTASGILLTLSGVGCSLVWDPDGYVGGVLANWTCSVSVRNAAGATAIVRSEDAVLQAINPRAFVSDSECAVTDRAEVEDDFLRWVQATLPFRYDGQDGPWCLQEAAGGAICTESSIAPEGASCETPLPTAPAFCDGGERCLALEPSRIDFFAIITAMGVDGRSPVGFPETRVTPTVEVRNSCSEPVRVYLDDELQGAASGDFTILNNLCAPRPGTDEETIGRELSAAGGAGDACTFDVRFSPTRHAMVRAAEKRFSQDTTELYIVPISGRGRGGNLQAAPANLCFDTLVGPRDGCTNATAVQTVTVQNIGRGRLTIESIVPTGQFQFAAPPPPLILELPPDPRASQTIDVWWCVDGPVVDDTASLLMTDNGITATTEILLERRSAGCP